jgi:hypothetical protein
VRAKSSAITISRRRTRSTAGEARAPSSIGDLTAPGPREWDLAYAAYRFVPLYSDAACVRLAIPVLPRGARLRILFDSYGFRDHAQLLGVVEERIFSLYEITRMWGEAGKPGWREVWRDTRGRQWLESLAFVKRHRAVWEHELAGG